MAEAAGGGPVDGTGDDGEWLYCTHRGKGRSKKRPLYQWTGKLRPHPVSPYRSVPAHIGRPDYASTGWPADEMESKKQNVVHLHSPAEVEGIRAACVLVRLAPRKCALQGDALKGLARDRAARCWMRALRRCGRA